MLDELIVIVEGYNFYFFFLKKRSGYFGEFEEVMFFYKFWCKNLSFLYIYYRVYVMLNN